MVIFFFVKLSDFDYHLPPELIAQTPAPSRESSRLMTVERRTGRIEHRRFRDLPALLSPDDLLVLNDTKVFKARLFGRRETGARVEALLIRPRGEDIWEVLLKPGRKVQPGNRILFEPGLFEAVALDSSASQIRRLRFEHQGDFWPWLEKLGSVPLPPYIRRSAGFSSSSDAERYQTVFAAVRGSIAAPTAGLHFTPEMLREVPHCFLTLHVGYGTFKPVSAERIEDHRMEPEHYRIGVETAGAVSAHLAAGKTLTAVGTTTTRALEHMAAKRGRIAPGEDWADLYIRPGHQFRTVGSLVTNFHLPRSTLLILVSAFAGRELVLECYRRAVQMKYRFYSYGDAMLIR